MASLLPSWMCRCANPDTTTGVESVEDPPQWPADKEKKQHLLYDRPVELHKPKPGVEIRVHECASNCKHLGVLRVDSTYQPPKGDVRHPDTFIYPSLHVVVKGLTYAMCINRTLTPEVEKNLIEAVKYMCTDKKVAGITGCCGLSLSFQSLIQKHSSVPVFMSSMMHLGAIRCAFGCPSGKKIAVMSGHLNSVKNMRQLIIDECAVDILDPASHFVHVDCRDIPGLDAAARGVAVDPLVVTVGMIAKACKVIREINGVQAIFLDHHDLPPYSDALRAATGLPVFDAVTNCDFFMSGHQCTAHWYTPEEKLYGPRSDEKKPNLYEGASLGVMRLDYNYPPAPGDIDHPASYKYPVHYKVVPGLTFGMCQANAMTDDVRRRWKESLDYLLNVKKVSGITGDCGFMMFFQDLARSHENVGKNPVFMSSLAHLPAVRCAVGPGKKIAIFTANASTLLPMADLIKQECWLSLDDERLMIVDCMDVAGFEAVALGLKVDVEKVKPGIVAKAVKIQRDNPDVAAILFECTELPPYAAAVRGATGLPVYDANTNCNFYIQGFADNPRFGVNKWQHEWDGHQERYTFGQELTSEERAALVT